MIGTTLGKYRITQRLAAGGMGEVYIGEHELIGRKAAIKVLLPHVSQKPQIVERFFQEAKATAAIGHPGIVEIFDFGYHDVDGRAYLVMEFLDGETLSQRIKAERRLSLEHCAIILRRVASALGAAHDKGIVHRDLKPDNIFLVPAAGASNSERVKILDFGIAKLRDGGGGALKTDTGVVMGTPAYMAPEQCRGVGHVDHRADLYSLGCIFFEMLCGRRPFIAAGVGELIGMHQFREPPRPRDIWPDLDPGAEALILDLLHKNPEDRVQSTRALRDRLEALIPVDTLSGIFTPRPGTVQPIGRNSSTLPSPRAATSRPYDGPVQRPATAQPVPAMSTPQPAAAHLAYAPVAGHPGSGEIPFHAMTAGASADGGITTLHGAASERSRGTLRGHEPTGHRGFVIAAVAALVFGVGVGGVLLIQGDDDETTSAVSPADEVEHPDVGNEVAEVLVAEEAQEPGIEMHPAGGEPVGEEPDRGDPDDDATPGDRSEEPETAGQEDADADADTDADVNENADAVANADDAAGGDDGGAEYEDEEREADEGPSTVTLTIDSKPPGATVTRFGQQVCKTRCTLEVERGEFVHLEVSKDGYMTKSVKLKARSDRRRSVTLDPAANNILVEIY